MKQELNEAQAAAAKRAIDDVLAAEKSWAETVRIGDLVDSTDDHHFTYSGTRYLTRGKLYTVKATDPRPDAKSFTVIVDSDVESEIAYINGSNVVIRDGVIVWNWIDTLRRGLDAGLAAEARGNGSGAAE